MSTPNIEAWVDGGVLQIADTKYDVTVNPPNVTRLVISSSIMVGCITYPDVLVEFASLGKSKFMWSRLVKEPMETMETEDAGASAEVIRKKKKPRPSKF